MSAQAIGSGLVEVVWWGTLTLRDRAHGRRGYPHCPSRFAPRSRAHPQRRKLDPRCREDGCLGIVHQVYAHSSERPAAPVAEDPVAEGPVAV